VVMKFASFGQCLLANDGLALDEILMATHGNEHIVAHIVATI
jgi:hypothetical protein